MSSKSRNRFEMLQRAALVLMLGATACASPGDPGVLVDKVSADLAFGAPSPNARPGLPQPRATPTFPGPFDFASPGPGPAFPPPPLPPPSVCPQARPTEFPEREAPIRLEGLPEQGAYLWVFQGDQAISESARVPLRPFSSREVLNPSRDALGRVSFRTREPDPALGSDDTVTSAFRGQGDGLYLTEITRSDKDGTSMFSPLAPILYLPIPVQPGASFQSRGVDLVTGQVLLHSGKVVSRARVDACGKIIEGWLVDAEQTITRVGQAPERRDYNYVVATHLGGLLIFEHLETPCTQMSAQGCQPPGDLRYNARLGQLHPTVQEKSS